MILSVLICTLPNRLDDLKTIMAKLLPYQNKIEILYLGDNKKRSVGKKRNDLLRLAQGDYVVFVDDDDRITDDYIPLLLKGCQSGSDIVLFDVECSVNGGEFKKVYYNAQYPADRDLVNYYERLPNHLMCVKRALALKVMFKEINMGEDGIYALGLKPLIRTQAYISKTLYYYVFSHKKSETQ
ncbi:MAG: glycosyltransferase [Bacteroidia bacterium]|nr:glycosyltransferase [Bacteroidia bacterium]